MWLKNLLNQINLSMCMLILFISEISDDEQ